MEEKQKEIGFKGSSASKETAASVTVKLPSLEELYGDADAALKNDQLNWFLNQPVFDKWIKKHPTAKTDYLPIDKVEFMLTKIFGGFKVEVISYSQLFNSVAVHVRLTVKNPIDGSDIVQDGLGACNIQTDKDASASDLSKIKSAAVMMALPAAESYAIKDAAEKLGRLFGKDLNRKDVVSQESINKIHERWKK